MGFLIEISKGNTYTRTVPITSGGAVFNLTGYLVEFIAKAKLTDVDADAVIKKALTITAPETGNAVLSLAHVDTDISPLTYMAEFKLYKSDGSFVQTLRQLSDTDNGIGRLVITPVVLQHTWVVFRARFLRLFV